MSVETNPHKYTNMNLIFSQFVAAEFPKTPSPKPARIPPQTPPAGGKIRRGFAKSFSPENSFGKTESVLKPHALPEYLEGRTPKEKHPFLFQKKFHPRQIRNARSVFSFGVAGVLASAWGFGSFVQFPLEKGSRKVYDYSTKTKLDGFFEANSWAAQSAAH
jgi:hypothetical protein